jgi:small subunit ribosomal protein S18
MARRRGPKDDRKGGDRKAGARRLKKKVCIFCSGRVVWVDYKDVNVLRRFMSDRGKIRARRVSGNCAQHQRDVAVAIKTARELALLPYTQRTVTERGPLRGMGRSGGSAERPPVPTAGPVTVEGGAPAPDGAEEAVVEPEVDAQPEGAMTTPAPETSAPEARAPETAEQA